MTVVPEDTAFCLEQDVAGRFSFPDKNPWSWVSKCYDNLQSKNYSCKLLIEWVTHQYKTLDSGLIWEDGNMKGGSCKTSNRSTSVINHLVNSTITVGSVCTKPCPGGWHLPPRVSCSWQISVHRSVTVGCNLY